MPSNPQRVGCADLTAVFGWEFNCFIWSFNPNTLCMSHLWMKNKMLYFTPSHEYCSKLDMHSYCTDNNNYHSFGPIPSSWRLWKMGAVQVLQVRLRLEGVKCETLGTVEACNPSSQRPVLQSQSFSLNIPWKHFRKTTGFRPLNEMVLPHVYSWFCALLFQRIPSSNSIHFEKQFLKLTLVIQNTVLQGEHLIPKLYRWMTDRALRRS